jgi:DNA-binding XRE family transcriptional regulator
MQKHYRPSANEAQQARLEAGLTQKNLADLLAVSEKSIQNYEQGRRRMPPPTWALMCVAVVAYGQRYPEDWCLFGGDETVL